LTFRFAPFTARNTAILENASDILSSAYAAIVGIAKGDGDEVHRIRNSLASRKTRIRFATLRNRSAFALQKRE